MKLYFYFLLTYNYTAMSPAEVTEKLGLHRMRDRSWFVHPSCATSGEVSVSAKIVPPPPPPLFFFALTNISNPILL